MPILFLVFNRPDTTAQVLQRIREIQPAKLFVAADGPRANREEERVKCEAVRSLILNGIDWPCDVKTLFRDQNLGCGKAVSRATTWFFEQVDEGIILEDNTVPDLSFFEFCKELLSKYRNEEKIKMISGNNFQNGKWRGDGSYYFSNITHSWGWATWRRAWKEYDYNLSSLDERKFEELLKRNIGLVQFRDYWRNIYHRLRDGSYDTWDYQFLFSMWLNDGICIVPNKNLVTNIGFGNNATHTTNSDDPVANQPLQQLNKIVHPSSYETDRQAEKYLYNKYIKQRGLVTRAYKKILRLLR